jgi:bifunctional DNase/RNase
MDEELNLIEMELREVQIKADALTGSQVVVLGEKNGPREFPIFIGFTEAIALDAAIHKQKPQRPLTHDLIGNVIHGLHGRLTHVIIDDLHDDIFFGKLAVRTPMDTEELIDSRPSDAIVLATKHEIPIFVAEEVLEKAARSFEE